MQFLKPYIWSFFFNFEGRELFFSITISKPLSRTVLILNLDFIFDFFFFKKWDQSFEKRRKRRGGIDTADYNAKDCSSLALKGRLDCDSRRVFYTTLEATQTRRTDLWVFTLLLSESRLFCVFLFLNDWHVTPRYPFDRCVQQLAKGFEYVYRVYGDCLCISLYFGLIELRIDLQ